eukprot:m.68312 g.68312  ORF g.68312 m.68312 type:complete len:127 (+) comp23944_c0_seq1:279-659(+)
MTTLESSSLASSTNQTNEVSSSSHASSSTSTTTSSVDIQTRFSAATTLLDEITEDLTTLIKPTGCPLASTFVVPEGRFTPFLAKLNSIKADLALDAPLVDTIELMDKHQALMQRSIQLETTILALS